VVSLQDLATSFENFWPQSFADEWDNVGLSSGSADAQIERILVAVDLTDSVIDEAVASNCQLIITHHPLILKPIDSLDEGKLKGHLFARLIRSEIAHFVAHTNADVQPDGASTEMAKAFGLSSITPLVNKFDVLGHGVVGELEIPVTLAAFAEIVATTLPKTSRRVVFSGNSDQIIRRVAICSGAGDSLIPVVLNTDADVYVTSDLRHHPALDAISTPRLGGPLALIDVSHWAAESLWVKSAIHRLAGIPGVSVHESTVNTDPWTQEVY
jgi:dinuclear metal center YbgI/SA1388 family protein